HLGGVAQGVADGDVGQAREGHDVAGGDVVAGDAAVGLEVIQLGQAALHADRRVVPVADHHFFAYAAGAVLDAANADAAHKIIVVDGGHQHLEGGVRIPLGGLDGVQDGVEQGHQVGAGDVGVQAGGAGPAAAVDHGALQLLVRGAQVHQQVQHLVHHFFDAGVGAVDLVDDHHQAQVLLQGLLQHEAGLGHAALGGVHQQDHAVDHFQHPLHFAAKVGVARGVHDVD